MNNPSISVVMSVYNNADTLSVALDSILSQEGVTLEFIVIDDGSTDDSGKILDKAAACDSRLKVIHKENEGLTRALIEGCEMASAPWLARQDADDISLPGRLCAQLERAQQPDEPVLIGCAVRVCSPEQDLLTELHPPVDVDAATRRVLEAGQAISSHGSILFSRVAYQKVGGYRAPFYYAQDIDLTTRLAEVGGVCAVAPVLYEYHYSPSAISGQHGGVQRRFYRLIRQGYDCRRRGESEQSLLEQAEILREQCLHKRGKKSKCEAFYFMGTCLMTSRPERARYYFRKAVGVRLWSVKAWVRLLQTGIEMKRNES
jgi:glycosyltransferase involved in cell wall biosynthesis